jgi:hypothetical protein
MPLAEAIWAIAVASTPVADDVPPDGIPALTAMIRCS